MYRNRPELMDAIEEANKSRLDGKISRIGFDCYGCGNLNSSCVSQLETCFFCSISLGRQENRDSRDYNRRHIVIFEKYREIFTQLEGYNDFLKLLAFCPKSVYNLVICGKCTRVIDEILDRNAKAIEEEEKIRMRHLCSDDDYDDDHDSHYHDDQLEDFGDEAFYGFSQD